MNSTIVEREIINIDVAINNISNCDLVCYREGRQTKSLWFRDKDNNLTCLIYNLLGGSSTILATVNFEHFNSTIDKALFFELWNKYKIVSSLLDKH
jgi:hypothetical protein